MELPLFVELNTSVNRLLGKSSISPGKGLVVSSDTVDVESLSLSASTTFKTGVAEPPAGINGLETKARSLTGPLVIVWLMFGL